MLFDKKPIILVDGSSYLFRAFYALPPLTNSKGKPTGAVFGVLNMLRKLIKDYGPKHMAVIFDPKGKTFRHEMYSEYKANRTEMPDDLQVQIAPLFSTIRALGIPLLVIEGIEADDLIATIAKRIAGENNLVLISTSDKDLAQIVDKNIILINTMTNKILDEAGVTEKFGVSANKMIDYLTLVGDSVDNVPGVPNVGPKTAVKWLTNYGSLTEIISHASEIPGKVGENLRNHLKDLPLYRTLVTVKTDVDCDIDLQRLLLSSPDYDQLIGLFHELEFKTWSKEIQELNRQQIKLHEEYQTVLTIEQLKKWTTELKQKNIIAFDTETTSQDAMEAELVGVSFAVRAHEAAYVPIAHNYSNSPQQLEKAMLLSQLKPILADENKLIIGQNLKYDLKVLKHDCIDIKCQLWDNKLASYVLNNTTIRHDLNSLAWYYLQHKTITFEEVAGVGGKQISFNLVGIDAATEYAAEDADITYRLYDVLNQKLIEQPKAKEIFTKIEMPLMKILFKMEYDGVLVDQEMLKQQSEILSKRLQEIADQVYRMAGEEFNLASPKQLNQILYQKLKIPVLKKTPTGQASTSEAVLLQLALDYPLPKYILEHRQLSKLKSTYTDRLPEQINPRTGRIHTSYHQVVTSTGRLSSSDPNLQNIPIRSSEGRKIRQAFIAPVGYQIVAADYSQIELRLMAHFTQDPNLLKAFANNHDIHRATAAEVFSVDIETVSDEQRRRAKAINFGLMYGMSSFGLAQQLGISREEAQKYIDIYFLRYPKVQEFIDRTRNLALQQGFVETMIGRKIYISEMHSANRQLRLAAERAAINAPLQGSAADIIKIAMIHINEWIENNTISLKMIMQVHDELVFEVAKSDISIAQEQIKKIMESAVKLTVPLQVVIGLGDNWDAAH